MTIEQRVEQLERQNKRQRIGMLVLAVALCGVVSMGAFGDYDVRKFDGITQFDTIWAKDIGIMNPDGQIVVDLTSINGKKGDGRISVRSGEGHKLVEINEMVSAHRITVFGDNSNRGVVISSNDEGSFLQLNNKTRESIITLGADEYGNGEVGVWNRKGKGRLYDSK